MESIQIIRPVVFFGLLLILLMAQTLWPRRDINVGKHRRWISNVMIFIVDSVITRVLFIFGGIAAAVWAQTQGLGLLNWISIPLWVSIILCVIVLDFSVWFQHVISHRWHWLWRLHRVHHSDTAIDVTTALRFHPLEIAASLIYKSAIVILLGAPVFAVLVFDIILNGCAMFNHANIHLPRRVDMILRKVIVTPDMHRVHHSVHNQESQKNFGFCLSIWDRIFGQYQAQPIDGHEAMDIGLVDFRDVKDQTVLALMGQPLKEEAGLEPL